MYRASSQKCLKALTHVLFQLLYFHISAIKYYTDTCIRVSQGEVFLLSLNVRDSCDEPLTDDPHYLVKSRHKNKYVFQLERRQWLYTTLWAHTQVKLYIFLHIKKENVSGNCSCAKRLPHITLMYLNQTDSGSCSNLFGVSYVINHDIQITMKLTSLTPLDA